MHIIVKGLSKSYGTKEVLKDFSYEFKPGLYILEGGNGKGKSTFIKILADVVSPTYLDELVIPKKISYLPEYIELSEGKVRPFLKSLKRMYESRSDVRSLMKEWNLENKRMNALSQGNRKKVMIIGTLMKRSVLYLYDEPTNGLDNDTILLFKEKIEELIDLDKTVIISTHEAKHFIDMNPEVISFD